MGKASVSLFVPTSGSSVQLEPVGYTPASGFQDAVFRSLGIGIAASGTAGTILLTNNAADTSTALLIKRIPTTGTTAFNAVEIDTSSIYNGSAGSNNAALVLSDDTPGANFNTSGLGPRAMLEILTNNNLGAHNGLYLCQGGSGNGSDLNFRKSRGTFASPASVALGDLGGTFSWDYFVATSPGDQFFHAAFIQGFVDTAGSVSTTSIPGTLLFSTAPNAGTVPVAAVAIRSNGALVVGSNSALGFSSNANPATPTTTSDTAIARTAAGSLVVTTAVTSSGASANAFLSASGLGVGTTASVANQLLFNSSSPTIQIGANLVYGQAVTLTASRTAAQLQMVQTNTDWQLGMDVVSNAAGGFPAIRAGRAKGTVGSPSAVTNSDSIWEVIGQGWVSGAGGDNFLGAASIVFKVDSTGSVSNTSMPGQIVFQTTADGSSSPSDRVRITSAGSVVLNSSGSALAQNATDGFTYVPRCLTGAPSGTPTAFTGATPLVVGGDNNLYAYLGAAWSQISNQAGSTPTLSSVLAAGNGTGGHSIAIPAASTDKIVFGGSGNCFIWTDTSVDAQNLTLAGQWKFTISATGAGTASLSTNCPAVTPTAPFTWIKMNANDGSIVYVPAWK